MSRPGDRRQRWHQSCNIKGAIMLFIGGMLIFTKSSFGIVFGLICLMCALLDFRDAKKGWKMSDKRPPWAGKHDAIEAKYHEMTEKTQCPYCNKTMNRCDLAWHWNNECSKYPPNTHVEQPCEGAKE